MFCAYSACTSRKSSTTVSITRCMSYGWLAESGISVSSSRSASVGAAGNGYAGTSSRLFDGRKDSSAWTYSIASSSDDAR